MWDRDRKKLQGGDFPTRAFWQGAMGLAVLILISHALVYLALGAP